MNEPIVLWTAGFLPVTAYALCLVIALGAALLLLKNNCKQMNLRADTAGTAALLALPLGLLGARAFYCAARIYFYLEIGLENILRLWDGGFALWGAVGGAALAGWLAARITRQRPALILDAMAAPGALVIALCRFAEYFNGEGWGPLVENPSLGFFPLAVFNAWSEEWYFAVFVLEGLAALGIFFALMRTQRAAGQTALLFLILYSSCQIVLESMRRDAYLSWLFVRVNQLTAVIVLAVMLLVFTALWLRKKNQRRAGAGRVALDWLLFLGCVGLCIALEFSVDGKIWDGLPVPAAYGLMALCCVIMGMVTCRMVFRSVQKKAS